MKKNVMLSFVFLVFSSFLFISPSLASCEKDDVYCRDMGKVLSVTKDDNAKETSVDFKEITEAKDIENYKKYWHEEINLGKETGKFYGFNMPLIKDNHLLISQMKTPLTCNTLGAKACKIKVTVIKKDGTFFNLMDKIYIDINKEKISLKKDAASPLPIIKVWDLEFSYNKDKKCYEISKDSRKPEEFEVIDPRGFDPADPKSDVSKETKPLSYLFNKIKEYSSYVFGVNKAYAANCPNGMVLPSTGTITSTFGDRYIGGKHSFHNGLDYGIPIGTSLPAIAGGKVIAAAGGCEPNGGYYGNNCNGGLGNYVKIQLTNGDVITYGHLSSIGVSNGQAVSAGTAIGNSGNSGSSTGPHLHFAVSVNDNPVDPAAYLSSCGATASNGTTPADGNAGTGGEAKKDDATRFQVENLPWYTGGDDTLSDTRYKELFGDTSSCSTAK